MVVVICRPAVLSCCSLMPAAESSSRTRVLIRPSGPESSSLSWFAASDTTWGYCMFWRSAADRLPPLTMPSST
ncbi:Uncharacterised protein [Mycobacteroides abscessus subsp. abscessus]|nr:Uncharacterised protein [Mycobacteroides abscessus subsp. abscessus]